MSDKQYATTAGFIQQFKDKPAVTERDTSAGTVRDVTIKTQGTNKLVRVTVWPEFSHVSLEAGQWIAVDGEFTINTSEKYPGQEFYNLSAYVLATAPVLRRQERQAPAQATASAPAARSGPSDDIPF